MNVLECYGVGTVAEDKETDSDEVQVYLASHFPDADGEVVATAEKQEITTRSPTGDTNSSTTLVSNSVPCKWMALNTNRVTSPDVRKGSKVVVYKFQGTNKYLWTYFGMDGTLRLETVVWAFSASPNISEDTPVTPDNYYMFLLSTHKKQIQLLTGQGNGEPVAYSITLDTNTGQFGIVDSENNIFSINSLSHAFSFINDEKSLINIQEKDITLSCENNMLLHGKEKINLKCTDLNMEASNSINVQTETTNWKSPTFNLEGNMFHKGNYEQEGNYTQLGNYTVTGDIGLTGNFGMKGGTGTSTGDWTINGISYLQHWHQGQHGPTSPPQA